MACCKPYGNAPHHPFCATTSGKLPMDIAAKAVHTSGTNGTTLSAFRNVDVVQFLVSIMGYLLVLNKRYIAFDSHAFFKALTESPIIVLSMVDGIINGFCFIGPHDMQISKRQYLELTHQEVVGHHLTSEIGIKTCCLNMISCIKGNGVMLFNYFGMVAGACDLDICSMMPLKNTENFYTSMGAVFVKRTWPDYYAIGVGKNPKDFFIKAFATKPYATVEYPFSSNFDEHVHELKKMPPIEAVATTNCKIFMHESNNFVATKVVTKYTIDAWKNIEVEKRSNIFVIKEPMAGKIVIVESQDGDKFTGPRSYDIARVGKGSLASNFDQPVASGDEDMEHVLDALDVLDVSDVSINAYKAKVYEAEVDVSKDVASMILEAKAEADAAVRAAAVFEGRFLEAKSTQCAAVASKESLAAAIAAHAAAMVAARAANELVVAAQIKMESLQAADVLAIAQAQGAAASLNELVQSRKRKRE